MTTNNITHEWQMIADDTVWNTLHQCKETVGLDTKGKRVRLTAEQWRWMGCICLAFVSTTIYLLWLQAKSENYVGQVSEQAKSIQVGGTAQATVVELKHRYIWSTEHFRFYFQPENASLVESIGPQIEDFYRSLRRDFGLLQHPERIVVEVEEGQIVGSRRHLDSGRWVITVPSPKSLVRPTDFSTTDTLFLFLASMLLEQAIEEMQQPTQVRWAWRQMPEIFRRWYLIYHHDTLSDWHDEMLGWMVSLDQPSTADVMPLSLRQTCRSFGQATHSIAWNSAIPVQACMEGESLPIPQLPMSLGVLNTATYDWAESTYRIKWWVRLKATETVIDYAVSQHGPEQIGPLFRGFMQYDSWEELVPAVFNTSVTEFEADWRGYVESLGQIEVEQPDVQ